MKQRAFTLIEVLVALMVFAVLATLTSSVLYNVFDTRKRLTNHSDKIAELQLAIFTLERDLVQAVRRKVNRGNFIVDSEIIGNNDYLEFTRMGNINPMSADKRSTLVRVAYFQKDNKLIRKLWTRLDTSKKKSTESVLLTNVDDIKFAYINSKLELLSRWQVASFTSNVLPSAIQLNLKLNSLGNISLLFDLPESFQETIRATITSQ
jgi:general secretion pathway protein J